jgi:RNA polymerase sigma-70 factor (ECF subfamily)
MSSVSKEMMHLDPSPEELIASARLGCVKSLGRLSERYRRYLLHVANDSLNPALRAKVAPSDLVQEAMLVAHQSFPTFEGGSEAELLAWLRHIVYFRALQTARRYFGTASRDLRREICMDGSGPASRELMPDRAITPCTGLVAKEQLSRIEEALSGLEESPRQVIEMRSARMSFAQIGEVLGCSAEAARKRWARAIAQLRLPLSDHE